MVDTQNGTLIMLMAVATSGKGLFTSLLTAHLASQKPPRKVTELALATALKQDLDPLFKAFGGTAFETDPVKKALIRPVLVSFGCSQRVLTNGRHWIDRLEPAVRAALGRDEVVVISDGRFMNEIVWGKTLGAKTIYIQRTGPDGQVVGPANVEEASQDAFLRRSADVTVEWETRPANELWAHVERAAREIGLS